MGEREGGSGASGGGEGNQNQFHSSRSVCRSVDLQHSMKAEKKSFVALADCKLRALAESVKEQNFDLEHK